MPVKTCKKDNLAIEIAANKIEEIRLSPGHKESKHSFYQHCLNLSERLHNVLVVATDGPEGKEQARFINGLGM